MANIGKYRCILVLKSLCYLYHYLIHENLIMGETFTLHIHILAYRRIIGSKYFSLFQLENLKLEYSHLQLCFYLPIVMNYEKCSYLKINKGGGNYSWEYGVTQYIKFSFIRICDMVSYLSGLLVTIDRSWVLGTSQAFPVFNFLPMNQWTYTSKT